MTKRVCDLPLGFQRSDRWKPWGFIYVTARRRLKGGVIKSWESFVSQSAVVGQAALILRLLQLLNGDKLLSPAYLISESEGKRGKVPPEHTLCERRGAFTG
jgi:hypothetical protein